MPYPNFTHEEREHLRACLSEAAGRRRSHQIIPPDPPISGHFPDATINDFPIATADRWVTGDQVRCQINNPKREPEDMPEVDPVFQETHEIPSTVIWNYSRVQIKVWKSHFVLCGMSRQGRGCSRDSAPVSRQRQSINGSYVYFLPINEAFSAFHRSFPFHPDTSVCLRRWLNKIQEIMGVDPICVSLLSRRFHLSEPRGYPNNAPIYQRYQEFYDAGSEFGMAYISEQVPIERCGICGAVSERCYMCRIPGVPCWYCSVCYTRAQREQSRRRVQWKEENFPPAAWERTGHLMQYSTNVLEYKQGFIKTPKDMHTEEPIMLGVELECEHVDSSDQGAEFVWNTMGQYAIAKYDGSLSRSVGLEIVTVPGTLQAHKDVIWKSFFESKPSTRLRGWYGRGCGMHVHISMRFISDLELGKMIQFINDPKNKALVDLIAGRPSSHYCNRRDNRDIKSAIRKDQDHYDALSFSGSTKRTVELRIFRSNLSPLGFWKNMEFTDALVRFAKSGVSMRDLTSEAFLTWILEPGQRAQYPNLTQFLVIRKKIKLRHTQDPKKPQIVKEDFVDGVKPCKNKAVPSGSGLSGDVF